MGRFRISCSHSFMERAIHNDITEASRIGPAAVYARSAFHADKDSCVLLGFVENAPAVPRLKLVSRVWLSGPLRQVVIATTCTSEPFMTSYRSALSGWLRCPWRHDVTHRSPVRCRQNDFGGCFSRANRSVACVHTRVASGPFRKSIDAAMLTRTTAGVTSRRREPFGLPPRIVGAGAQPSSLECSPRRCHERLW